MRPRPAVRAAHHADRPVLHVVPMINEQPHVHTERGYARASYASGGDGASRVPRIAGDVTADPALASCVPVSYAPYAERRRL